MRAIPVGAGLGTGNGDAVGAVVGISVNVGDGNDAMLIVGDAVVGKGKVASTLLLVKGSVGRNVGARVGRNVGAGVGRIWDSQVERYRAPLPTTTAIITRCKAQPQAQQPPNNI